MYTKEENRIGKQAFWTAFGKYMKPVTGADGMPGKWINYETGISGLHLRLLLQQDGAFAGIEIGDASSERGKLLTATLLQTLPVLKSFTHADWEWMEISDRPVGSLFLGEKLAFKISLRQSDWPELISFFKEKMIAMDAYWMEVQPVFEML